MIKQLIILALLFSISCVGFAGAVSHPCTREAMDEISNTSKKYIKYFAEQKNRQAIEAISKVQLPKPFITRYEAELKMLADDANYQPSQAFCDGIYNIKAEMDRKLKTIAEEYKYPIEEDEIDKNINKNK